MESLTNIWLIALLFILRLGVPVLVILGIGLLLKRLDARWQAEAQQAQQVRKAQETAPAVRYAIPALPVSQSPLMPLAANGAKSMPCWMVKGCTESMRAQCAATFQPMSACWQARATAEGRLPAECKGCELYVPGLSRTTETAMVH